MTTSCQENDAPRWPRTPRTPALSVMDRAGDDHSQIARHTERMDKQVFTGGLRTSSGFNATIPFARLILADEGMTLRLFGFVYAHGDWSTVRSAQRVVGGLLGSPGVRIVLGDAKQFVFWSYHPQRVLDALSGRGVPIVDPGAKPPKVWLGS